MQVHVSLVFITKEKYQPLQYLHCFSGIEWLYTECIFTGFLFKYCWLFAIKFQQLHFKGFSYK